ncbi:tripartite tricarboxylate transporter TctB family protein [Kushneria indalinina]|uniref:Tripartite tricarboxylate transporter TctB family protein n=1 Tax=Kushneria indalinina DSM 14324 TaxID=1122140 RepID=A0A3D9DSX2_9GAMM|nr:tripartite tricarboxylate transporter TctB family protein [Kushneria indalinina]REC93837.1 tripartite tricarboxylate transporter TctB family protein [Kushneria indalinina DSM 14324]
MRSTFTLRAAIPLAVVTLVALLAVLRAFSFDEVPAILARGMQPATFPQLVAGLVVVLAGVAFLQDLRRPPAPQTALPRIYYLTVLLMALFAALLVLNLFLVALVVVTPGAALMWGERRPLMLIIMALAPLAAIVLFDMVFEVRFPRSPLMNLYYQWS